MSQHAAPCRPGSTISVWNNGDGVPVEVHKEEGVYVPELIFGHLLTSSNYNDSEKKVACLPATIGTVSHAVRPSMHARQAAVLAPHQCQQSVHAACSVALDLLVCGAVCVAGGE